VLVIEDEKDVADAYASQLSAAYETRVAYTGEDGLEMVNATVDIILLDRQMPGISGDEVLEKIRRDEYDCKIIIISAVDPDFDIIELPVDEMRSHVSELETALCETIDDFDE